MKRIALLAALFTALPLALAATSAHADARSDALAVVEREMEKVESAAPRKKTFSRMAQPLSYDPELDADASVDAKGRAFYAFRVDQGSESLAGCVYAATADVFITKKGAVYPVAHLRGKRVKRAAAGTCVSAEVSSTKLSQVFAAPPPSKHARRR
ncbi:MAG: hypothetical protein IPL79_17000 [Myxococcales bacterium]|nr:hypothetical protein [Myxococcales bacterium]